MKCAGLVLRGEAGFAGTVKGREGNNGSWSPAPAQTIAVLFLLRCLLLRCFFLRFLLRCHHHLLTSCRLSFLRAASDCIALPTHRLQIIRRLILSFLLQKSNATMLGAPILCHVSKKMQHLFAKKLCSSVLLLQICLRNSCAHGTAFDVFYAGFSAQT